MSLLSSCSRLHTSLSINLPSWDTPRRTADDILSTVDASGSGMRVVSISNKMVHSTGSSSLPQPSQIFMVRSISWIINADGVRELIELVQIGVVPITPTPATIDPISEPPPRSPSSTIHRLVPCQPDILSIAKSRFNIYLNILQSLYIAIIFLQAVFSIFALQTIF